MLLGLNGKAGVGKDTVANILVQDYGFKRYAFADAVRTMALSIDPIIRTQASDVIGQATREYRLSEYVEGLGWDKAKREIPEVRRLLQVIGTEAGRQVMGKNCWVNIVRNNWISDGCPDAVITDLRFENEQEFVKESHGFVIEIIRPNNPDAIATTHASEQFIPTPDIQIYNGGSLDELARTVAGTVGLARANDHV